MIFNKPYRIVMIDDDEDMLDLLRLHLDRLDNNDVTFSAFVDAREAMAFIENHDVHIVVTDLSLSDTDGVDVITKCLRLEKGIQVVVLSGDKKVLTALECFNRGAKFYLDKPVERELFYNVIKDCIKFLDNWHDLVKKRLHK